MKKYILFATAAIVALSGCVKDKETEFSENQVSFNATSGSLETRTYYGSETGNSQTFVNWKDGDEVTIMSTYTDGTDDGTGSRNPVNYTIENRVEGTVTQEGIKISNAKIFPTDETSVIEWGAGTNVFYGMYPKTGTISGSSLTMGSSKPTMTCVIPASWSPSITVERDELVELPYGYMFARTETPRTTEVQMTFNPKFTAFYFTLNNNTGNSISLSSLTLSSGGQALNGTFSVDTSSDAGTVSITTPGSGEVPAANKSIIVKFPKDFAIGAYNSQSFTVVALPKAYPQLANDEFTSLPSRDYFKDLTVTVTQGTGPSAVTKTLKLGKKTRPDDETSYVPIAFEAGKKHNISLTLPDFTNFTYTFSVTQQPVDLNYAASNVAHAAVQSFRSDNTPVPWRVKGYYTTEALAEAGGTPNLDVSSWDLTGLPASGSTSTPSGTSAQALSIGHAAITPTAGTAISSNVAASINSSIASRAAVGSPGSPINLSNPNGSSDSITESANCYIVNGPGWYKIPLVMGNGVKNNAVNTSSFGNAWLVDHAYQQVTDPVLPSTVCSPNVVWQDVSGLVTDVVIMTDEQNNKITSTTTDDKTVYWLKFKVNSVYNTSNKQQGNAVISVSNSSNVIWSYHIWVTSHVTGSESVAVQSNKSVLPVPIGWVTTGGTITPKTAVAYARLEQVENNSVKNYAVMKLELPTIYSCDYSTRGYAAYYQFGRKDPFLSTNPGQLATVDPSYTSTNDANAKKNIAQAIQNPGNLIKTGGSSWFRSSNNVATLWVLSSSKTIYDPSPSGYRVCDSDALDEQSSSFIPRIADDQGSGHMSDKYTLSDTNYLWIWANTTKSADAFNASIIDGRVYYNNTANPTVVLSTATRNIKEASWVIPMKTN